MFSRSFDTSDIAQAADHKFGFGHFDQSAADIIVAALDGHPNFLEREIERQKFIGVYNNLVLFDKAADGRHFRPRRNAGQFVAQKPILNRAQLGQVMTIALQDVLIHPAYTGGIGT